MSVMSRTRSSIRATVIARSAGVLRARLRWLGSTYRSTNSQSLPENRKASDRRSISLASSVPLVERISTVAIVGHPRLKSGSGWFPLALAHWTTLSWCGHEFTNGGRTGSHGFKITRVCRVSRTASLPTPLPVLLMSANPSPDRTGRSMSSTWRALARPAGSLVRWAPQ